MTVHELTRLSAREAVRLLHAGEVSPLELIDAALARMDAVDSIVNAVPTRCPDRAREHARRIMDRTAPSGRLGGLPVLVKDLVEVAGVRTTHGSPIFADWVPEHSDLQVERMEAAGGIVLGKTNTPEFGAGANTFNEVFGVTRNPWDPRLTCGGSSGGAAVALATGMAWLADGSDLGGSLRTPAAFCGIVGLRPSPGRVPHGPRAAPFGTLAVNGPMARDVRDLALFLDVLAGFDPRDPLSYDDPSTPYVDAVASTTPPRRVAFTPDLGGITPVNPEIAAACHRAATRFAELGAEVEEATPDLSSAVEVFTTLRAASYAANMEPLLQTHRDLLKPEVIWNIEHGLRLTAGEIGRAERERGMLQHRMAEFLTRYDILCCPTAIVPPFPVEQRYLAELNGHRFPSYIDWVAIAYAITLTACPALSLPCGFTASGLPVGLQIVGPPRGEAKLLAAAAILEDALELTANMPIDPRPTA